ncbi:MAG: helicase HerA domain-containing protein [Candidatus Thorarchaeota archaeon]
MKNLKNNYDKAENIGVVGSPSSTGELTLDIVGTAVNKGLVGKLAIFNYFQDSSDHFALGQITEIIMQNVWAQDPTMRGIIRQRGRVDPITEKQDIHLAKMRISSVLAIDDQRIEPSIFGTVPSTGTSIKLLDDNLMEILFEKFRDQLFYLGKSYGTDIKMPMWFKHFGNGKTGAGEAYHIGIFGKTGSGKSVLSKMIMLGYAQHAEISIFILDPQGEFSRDIRNNDNIKEILEKKYKRKIELYNLHNLVLSNWELFRKILANSEFFARLGVIHIINRMQAAMEVQKALRSTKLVSSKITSFAGESSMEKITLPKTFQKASFDKVWDALGEDNVQKMIYSSKDLKARVQNNYQNADQAEYFEIWKRIANLFKYEGRKNAIGIYDLVEKISGSSF